MLETQVCFAFKYSEELGHDSVAKEEYLWASFEAAYITLVNALGVLEREVNATARSYFSSLEIEFIVSLCAVGFLLQV